VSAPIHHGTDNQTFHKRVGSSVHFSTRFIRHGIDGRLLECRSTNERCAIVGVTQTNHGESFTDSRNSIVVIELDWRDIKDWRTEFQERHIVLKGVGSVVGMDSSINDISINVSIVISSCVGIDNGGEESGLVLTVSSRHDNVGTYQCTSTPYAIGMLDSSEEREAVTLGIMASHNSRCGTTQQTSKTPLKGQ